MNLEGVLSTTYILIIISMVDSKEKKKTLYALVFNYTTKAVCTQRNSRYQFTIKPRGY